MFNPFLLVNIVNINILSIYSPQFDRVKLHHIQIPQWIHLLFLARPLPMSSVECMEIRLAAQV